LKEDDDDDDDDESKLRCSSLWNFILLLLPVFGCRHFPQHFVCQMSSICVKVSLFRIVCFRHFSTLFTSLFV